MATYKCNVEQAKIYSKVGSGDIGALKRNELFFSDGREFQDPHGALYLYGNGNGKTGYVKKAQLTFVPSSPPPPDPDPDPEPEPEPDVEYILHVKNGVSRKYIPE